MHLLPRIGAVFLALSAAAWAHDPGLSSANVTVDPAVVRVQLLFAPADLLALGNPDPALQLARAAQWRVEGRDVAAIRAQVGERQGDNVEFLFVFPRGLEGRAVFHSALLGELPRGHRQLFTARDSAGNLIESRLLSASQESVEVALPAAQATIAPQARHSFAALVLLGVEHILTGYDHLLFLAALLLVCESAGGAVRIVTFFTLAHSLTLALATFGVVTLPASVVEPVIAATIVFVGIENIVRGSCPRWRWALTLGFGLVHGLGFAGVLQELGVARGTVADAVIPLFAFNLGVELGQLGVTALFLPFLLFARTFSTFVRRGVPALSAVIACAGGYWMISRVASL